MLLQELPSLVFIDCFLQCSWWQCLLQRVVAGALVYQQDSLGLQLAQLCQDLCICAHPKCRTHSPSSFGCSATFSVLVICTIWKHLVLIMMSDCMLVILRSTGLELLCMLSLTQQRITLTRMVVCQAPPVTGSLVLHPKQSTQHETSVTRPESV